MTFGDGAAIAAVRFWRRQEVPGRAQLLVLIALSGAGGCSSSADAEKMADPRVRYEAALEAMIDGNFTEAATEFETVLGSTLNPALTQLATLRLGDALFFQGKHAEAAEVYREFLEQFPRSPDAPHARYMRGLSFMRRMPEDSWIMPPAESRETTDVDAAYAALVELVERHPDSFYALRARALLAQCIERQCRHDLYVARFYEGRDNPAAVVQRVRQAVAREEREKKAGHLPGWALCAESRGSLLMAAEAYAALGDEAGLGWVRERYVEHQGEYSSPEAGLEEIDRMIGGEEEEE